MRSSTSSSKPPVKSGVGRARAAAARVSKSHLGVMLASLAAGSAATVTVLDSWDKVLVDLGFKQSEAVVLAEQGQQGDLLRQMVRLISQRVFWTERFIGDLADGFPQPDQDESWRRYNDAVIAWNESYLLSAILIEKYFNEQSKKELADLNWLLRQVNTCVNKIHYPELYKAKDAACHFGNANGGSEQDNIRVLQDTLKQVDAKIGSLAVLLTK